MTGNQNIDNRNYKLLIVAPNEYDRDDWKEFGDKTSWQRFWQQVGKNPLSPINSISIVVEPVVANTPVYVLQHNANLVLLYIENGINIGQKIRFFKEGLDAIVETHQDRPEVPIGVVIQNTNIAAFIGGQLTADERFPSYMQGSAHVQFKYVGARFALEPRTRLENKFFSMIPYLIS